MHISDLEIKGFKSFVDPTRLKFAEGLTCIVGPNGCGKTNVVDAIRWVVGEQKSSVLRSQTMTDVIFSGSSSRKPVNFAEVSLTIHNDSGILPVEYSEVVISRRVFRDGTSEYFLNKTPCRLRDITDLFVDTGMGADAYSVIELKMVESILSESKDERRRLIEEASGINKYKQQRRLSMRRLDATETDLNRVGDIIQEVEKNVGALRRQLARYKRFDRVRSQLQSDEMLLATYHLTQVQTELTPQEQRATELRQGYGLSGEQVGVEEERVSAAKAEMEDLEKELSAQQELVGAKRTSQIAIEQTLLLAEEKIANATAALDRLQVEEATSQEREAAAGKLEAELQKSLEELQPHLDETALQFRKIQDEFEERAREFQEGRKVLDEVTASQRSLLNEQADVERKQNRLDASLQQYRQQLQSLAEKRKRLDQAGQGYQLDLNLMTADFNAAEKLYTKLNEETNAGETHFREMQDRLSELREGLAQLRGERVSVERQLSFYEELLESGEGLSSGVRDILKAYDHVKGVLGTVADLLDVPEAYEQAIQVVLGPMAEAVVVQDRETALQGVSYLSGKARGHATFLPLKELKARTAELPAVPTETGVIGPAASLISVGKDLQGLLQVLLGDVLLVEPDFVPSRIQYPGRIVTLDGTVYDPLGWIHGGQGGTATETLVGRRDRCERLRRKYADLSEEIEARTQELEALHTEIGKTEKALRTARTSREDQRQILLEFERKSSRAQYGIRSTRSDLESLDTEMSALEQAVASAQTEREALQPQLESIIKHQAEVEVERDRNQEKVRELLAIRDSASESAQTARLEMVNLENDRRNLQTRLEGVAATLQDIVGRRQQLEEETREQREVQGRNRAIQTEEKERLAGIKVEVDRETEALAEIQSRNVIKRKQLNELELRLRDHHHQREAAAEELQELAARIAQLQSRRQHILDRIREKYDDTPPTELPEEAPDPEALEKRIRRGERFIENLGPINMGVQDEFEAEQARLNFLREQETDLIEARASLLETISKLDRIARKQFRETFAAIQQHFDVTFQMLFEGGHAELSLDKPEDVLESDIIIRATPRGKKSQNLKMLSAGEKALTAIALLFAIYQVKPSPYCVLDEVDAPLDDRNIRKYTKMLEHFTTHTQFIVITHNKLTMEAARYLYGVTMEEEGVSKLVSVQLT